MVAVRGLRGFTQALPISNKRYPLVRQSRFNRGLLALRLCCTALSAAGVHRLSAGELHKECTNRAMNVGSCHHGMARPQVADGGTASDMDGSCE
jgi:hypothetical protein